MAIRRAAQPARTSISNREKYWAVFRLHCHRMVAIGYADIRGQITATTDEDTITQDLVRAIRERRDAPGCPRWLERYLTQEQQVLNAPQLTGKRRPVIDIEVLDDRHCPTPKYHFEAKRLRLEDSHAVSEYVGPLGLGEFIEERYARDAAEGGMLGYIQSGTVEHWAERLAWKLTNTPETLCVGQWQRHRIIEELPDTFLSRHGRNTLGEIEIYHTLLLFAE